MHALAIDGVIKELGTLPRAARRLDTGEWVLGLRDAPVELQQATGWFEVVDVDQPAGDLTTTHDHTVQLVDGSPTVVWTARAKTPEELAQDAAAANRSAIETNLLADMATMQAVIDAPNPSFTDVAGAQTAARAAARERKDIARMLRRIGRHLLNDFEGTS